jgi:hypothetical protein
MMVSSFGSELQGKSNFAFMRTLRSNTNSNMMVSSFGSELQGKSNLAKERKQLDPHRKFSVLDTSKNPNFLHMIQKLKLPNNSGKNMKKFNDIIKKSNSTEIQQMIGALFKKVPKNTDIQQILGTFIKKSGAKKPKMVNKKTQTKVKKILKIKKSSSLPKSDLKKKSSKPPKKNKKKSKPKKEESENSQSKKRNKNKSSKSSLSTSPFRTTSVGGQSLVIKPNKNTGEDVFLTKSVNNFDELPKQKSKHI